MASLKVNVGFALETTNKGFNYKDLLIPIEKDSTNFDITQINDLTAINNSLHNIFTWVKGERILNPEFGNPIFPFLYEGITPGLSVNIKNSISEAIKLFEPRVKLIEVLVHPNEDKNEVSIEILYSVPALNENNLKYNYIIPVQV